MGILPNDIDILPPYDAVDADEVKEILDVILATVPALQIYLFGSHADGTPSPDSDYDFYVVIPDNYLRPLEATRKISMALRYVRKRPIDMLVSTESKFNMYKSMYSIESEVFNNGMMLYG